jgi:hypothetical protein
MAQTLFQLDPSLPFAAFVNPKIADTQRLTASGGIAYPYRQLVVAFPGDPLVGTTIPNSTIKWNASTETQGLIFEYYQVNGEANPSGPAFPADMDAILKANAGPDDYWNGSYEAYGIPPGTFPKFPTAYTAEVGTGRSVEVFIP